MPKPDDDALSRPPRILLGVTASIGVLSLPHYLLALRRALPEAEVRAVMSDAAAGMLPVDSVAPFCHNAVAPGEFWKGVDIGHIALADWPDVLVVLPASCDVIARMAHGLTDKPVSLLALSHPRPVMLFPNMNQYLWERPSTVRNVRTLREDGHVVVEPLATDAFAAAAGRFETGFTIPPPATAVAHLVEELERRRPNPSASLGPD